VSEPIAPEHAAQTKGLAGKLQHKVGPFPLWLWIGLGGGAVLLLLKRGSGAGGSSGAPTDPAASSDPLSGAPVDVPGGGGGDSGPTGNVGGVEDPLPADPGSFFDPGFIDPTPPAAPIVFGTREGSHGISPDALVNHPLFVNPRTGASLFGGAAAPASETKGLATRLGIGLTPIVHSGDSSAGRIAAATTPSSVSPNGSIIVHASSFGGTAQKPVAAKLGVGSSSRFAA
jgi:hypothetical protein